MWEEGILVECSSRLLDRAHMAPILTSRLATQFKGAYKDVVDGGKVPEGNPWTGSAVGRLFVIAGLDCSLGGEWNEFLQSRKVSCG